MKTFLFLSLCVFTFFACEKDHVFEDSHYACPRVPVEENTLHPKHEKYQDLMEDMINSGVPGVMMSVHDPENGIWSGASGKADLASNVKLSPCNITRVGSTVKTFTAVTILLLQEEGKLDIDDKISNYLTAEYLRGLANAPELTIRQLLQHSSGLYNYISNLHFQTASLNDLEKVWRPEELLSYARERTHDFEPGSDVEYSNTNYILLGEIIEAVEGKPFYQVFEEKIFLPLNLSRTRFAAEDPVPENIIRGYIDLYSNLNLVNSTYYSGWDYYTADGGLISNANDLNIFLNALFNGNILTEKSMKAMLEWQEPKDQDEEGFETFFGLGIFRISTDHGPAYLHSGDAIGYFASMVYFPEQDVIITWAVNGNYGKIDEFTSTKEAMEKIFRTVLD